MATSTSPKRRRGALVIGALAFAALFAVAGTVSIATVQNDLTDRVETLAADTGYDDLRITFSGQDGFVHCDVVVPPDRRAELRELATDEWGVASLTFKNCDGAGREGDDGSAEGDDAAGASTGDTTTAPTTTPRTDTIDRTQIDATLAATAPRATLTGAVATDAQRDAIVTAAAEAYGADNVDDRLTVRTADESAAAGDNADDVDADAVTSLASLFDPAAEHLSSGHLRLVEGRITVEGTYLSDAGETAVRDAASAAGVVDADVDLAPRATATADDAADVERSLNELVDSAPIPFASGSATILPEGEPILDDVAALAQSFAGVDITIDGYTDSDGDDAANLALSQARADAVRDALVARGVPAEQLDPVGHGEADPVAPNDTPENKARNRRVTFSVTSN